MDPAQSVPFEQCQGLFPPIEIIRKLDYDIVFRKVDRDSGTDCSDVSAPLYVRVPEGSCSQIPFTAELDLAKKDLELAACAPMCFNQILGVPVYRKLAEALDGIAQQQHQTSEAAMEVYLRSSGMEIERLRYVFRGPNSATGKPETQKVIMKRRATFSHGAIIFAATSAKAFTRLLTACCKRDRVMLRVDRLSLQTENDDTDKFRLESHALALRKMGDQWYFDDPSKIKTRWYEVTENWGSLLLELRGVM